MAGDSVVSLEWGWRQRAALYDLVGLPIPSADQIARDAAYQSPDEVKSGS